MTLLVHDEFRSTTIGQRSGESFRDRRTELDRLPGSHLTPSEITSRPPLNVSERIERADAEVPAARARDPSVALVAAFRIVFIIITACYTSGTGA